MMMRFAVLVFFSAIFSFRCDGLPCTAVTKSLLAEFAEIPQTDGIRRGESVFNRERANFNVTKDYGFLVDQPANRVKSLIEGWTSTGILGSDATMVWHRFNQTLGRKAKGSLTSQMTNPGMETWNALQFSSVRTSGNRLSVAYAFLILKGKNNQVRTTNEESIDLGSFVVYKNRKDFNALLTNEQQCN